MTDLSRAKAFVGNSELRKMAPDELAHHGVMGQKWGHRKDDSVAREARQERNARNTRNKLAVGTLGGSIAAKAAINAIKKRNAAINASASADHKTSRELVKRRTSELSNADIDKIVQRLQKESNLKRVNPNSVDRGKKIVLGLVAAGTTAVTVYNLVNSPAGKAGIAHGKKVVEAILAKKE